MGAKKSIIKNDINGKPIKEGDRFKFKFLKALDNDNSIELIGSFDWNDDELRYEIDASDKSVIWSSSNSSVASVNTSGVVTGISAGSATITATSNADGTITDNCVVTVNTSTGVEITETEPSNYSLFPNPAGTEITISNVDGSQTVKVYSENGMMYDFELL